MIRRLGGGPGCPERKASSGSHGDSQRGAPLSRAPAALSLMESSVYAHRGLSLRRPATTDDDKDALGGDANGEDRS